MTRNTNSISHAILVRAREILADPAHWTRGDAARNAKGYATASSDPNATSFCTIGALNRAERDVRVKQAPCLGLGRASEALDIATDAVRDALPTHRHLISGFNDDPNTKHEDVIRVLDTAISNMAPLQEPQTP